MKIERTKNTIRGSVWGLINQFAAIIYPFITRTCILYVMGAKYVGLGSLFTSILSVLSLAELGVGSAIIYSMYEPIANDDKKKICQLLKLYKNIYFFIGGVILVIGLFIMPFLRYMINDTVPNGINIYLLFAMYLANSVVSYWVCGYKGCLLSALQRNDVLTQISILIKTIIFLLQIIAVYFIKDYYLYVLLMPIMTASTNVITTYYVNKKYPMYQPVGKVEKKEISNIKKQVMGLLSQKLAYTSRNTLDNIIISSFVGLTVVAIYGNYYYIINSMTGILAVLFTSMQAGIGNSIVKESMEKNYEDLLNINFIYLWISTVFSVVFSVSAQPFMDLWAGRNMTFPVFVVYLLAMYFYIMKMTDTLGGYIAAAGLWWNCMWVYFLETATNLILNIILGYFYGVVGVIVATIISVLVINWLLTCIIIHKRYFIQFNALQYIIKNIIYLFVFSLVLFTSCYIINNLYILSNINNTLLELLIKGGLGVILPNVMLLFFYFWTPRYKWSFKWLYSKLRKV